MSQPNPSFLLSAGVAQAVQRMPAVAFGNELRWFDSHYRHIPYVAQVVECMLGVALTNYVGSIPTISIFLYVAQAVERVVGVALRNELRWFESHYRHISLCSPNC